MTSPPANSPQSQSGGSSPALVLGLGLVVEIATVLYVLLAIWPAVAAVPSGAVVGAQAARSISTVHALSLFGYEWHDPSPDGLYLIAVMLLGALGASIAALISFSTFVGN